MIAIVDVLLLVSAFLPSLVDIRTHPIGSRLVSAIDMRNSAYRSLSLQYQQTNRKASAPTTDIQDVMEHGTLLRISGRYISSGTQAYSECTMPDGLPYVYAYDGQFAVIRNGNQSLLARSRNKNAFHPAFQNPWEQQEMGSSRLADESFMQIEDIGMDSVGGQPAIKVTAKRVLAPKYASQDSQLIMWYAADTYLLLRGEATLDGRKFGHYELLREAAFSVDGNVLHVPLSSIQIMYTPNDESVSGVYEYSIPQEGVQFNVDVPPEQFTLRPRPEDQVFDVDLDEFVTDPGRLLSLDSLAGIERPPSSKPAGTMPTQSGPKNPPERKDAAVPTHGYNLPISTHLYGVGTWIAATAIVCVLLAFLAWTTWLRRSAGRRQEENTGGSR